MDQKRRRRERHVGGAGVEPARATERDGRATVEIDLAEAAETFRAHILGDRPRGIERQCAADTGNIVRSGDAPAVGEIDIAGADRRAAALPVQPGAIEGQRADRVGGIADLQPIGIVEIDHRRAAQAERGGVREVGDHRRVEHHARAAAADIDDRAGDVVIRGFQDRVGCERTAAAAVERQGIAAVDDRAGADGERSQRRRGARRRAGTGILTGHEMPRHVHGGAVGDPQQRAVAVDPGGISGQLSLAVVLRDGIGPEGDVAVGALGHRADRPDHAAGVDRDALVAGERDQDQLGAGQRMLGIGRDLEVERVGGDQLAARVERCGAADQHGVRTELADLVGVEDEVASRGGREAAVDIRRGNQDVAGADGDLPATAFQARRQGAGAGREQIDAREVERVGRAERQQAAVDRQRRHRGIGDESDLAEEARARGDVDL